MRLIRRKRENRSDGTKRKMIVCLAITLVFFALFAARLVDWQLIHGGEYKKLAARSTGYTTETEATRGEILDKNGVGLVTNSTHYKVVIDKLYAEEDRLDSTILQLIEIMEKTGEKWNDVLPIKYSRSGYYFAADSEEEKTRLLSDSFLDLPESTSANECVTALKERYKVSSEFSGQRLRDVLSVRYNMEKEQYSNSKPYVFAEDISQPSVGSVSENTQGIKGVDVQTYLVRVASDPDIAPHLLGALGSVTEEEYNEKNSSDSGKKYALNDKIGKFGIELAFESQLKGEGGMKIVHRSADGTVADTVQTVDSKPGNTVWLTLDSKLQETAVKSLAENVRAAKAQGKALSEQTGEKMVGEDCEAGAVVMLSVKDFSVLAAASYPTYDLNRYSEYGSYYVKLAEGENSPMFNRAFIGSFACGSVYKPLVAGAALEEGKIKPDTEIFCNQKYDYYPSNVVRCMHYHGDMNVTGAIAQSCNYFFAEAGRRLGIEPMYLYSERFGLGEYTGVEIEESKGTLAGRDSTSWMPGNTVSAAIGQSDNAFTPLQLATYTATIANNGVRLKTSVVSKITDYERKTVIEDYSKAEQVSTGGISQKNLDIVKKAMLEVTQNEDGTAYSVFGNYPIKVAAKTGTAENSGSDHTTFICFAPYDKPEVAVAVVLENGKKSKFSMQVAKDLLDSYFGLNKKSYKVNADTL